MKTTKIKETYICEENDSKAYLEINFKNNMYEITRVRIESDSDIIPKIEEFAESIINKQNYANLFNR